MKIKSQKKCRLYYKKHKKTKKNKLIEFIIKYHPGNEVIEQIYKIKNRP